MPGHERQSVLLRAKTSPRYRFVIAGLTLFAYLSLGLNLQSVSPLLPLVIQDYGISRAAGGLLSALPLLVQALIGLPGTVLISRLGLKRTLVASWCMVGCLALSALAPNYLALLALRFVFGLGAGLMLPALGSLVMQWLLPPEIVVINTLGLVVMSLGLAAAVSSAAPLAAVMAWPSVLSLFGVIALLGAAGWLVLGRTHPQVAETAPDFSLADIWSVLRDRTIFLLVVGDALVFILYSALTSWLPTFFHELRGMSLIEAGRLTGLLPFVGIFAALAGGMLALRVRSRRWFFILPGILVGLGGLGTFLLVQPALITASVVMVGIGTWIYQPILLTLPMQITWMTPNKVAVVAGASLTIAGLGMFISPVVVGASRDLLGTFVPGFLVWAIPAWALVFTGLFLPETEVASHVAGLEA